AAAPRLGEGVHQRSIASTALTHAERDLAAASRRRKRLLAFTFVAPLLLFILLSFVAPIASMLWRSVYHPTVAELIPATLEQLEQWDGSGTPSQATLTAFAEELHRLAKERQSGKLAEELNRTQAGMSSMVKTSARRVGRLKPEALAQQGVETLLESHRNWSQP